MPDDVRITKPAPGSVPTVDAVVAPPVVVAAAPAAAPEAVVVAAPPAVALEAAPIAAPVVEAPVVEAAVEEMPTAQPTLFEKFEKKQADAAAAAAAADKPAVEVEKPAGEADKPAAEAAVEKPAEQAAVDKPVAAAEGEKPAAEPAKPAVEATPVQPQPVAVKWDYQLPENVTLPEKETGELHGALQRFATNPGDKEGQQALVDFHFARLRDSLIDYNRQAHKAFSDKRMEWQKAVENHPEIGGGNHDAAMQAIAYVRDNYITDPSVHPRGSRQYEEAKAGLDAWMHLTGAGDNPWFLQMMHVISQRLNEPQIQATQEVRPIVQNDNGGRPAIYKHPTSFPRR